MSAPAINALSPLPVRIATFIFLLFSSLSMADDSSRRVSLFNAFNASGLLMVIVAIPSSSFTTIFL